MKNNNITPSIRFTCEAVINFENIAKKCPVRIDPITGRTQRVLPKGCVQGLKEGAQSYYDRAVEAEQCAQSYMTRVFEAEASARESRELAIQAEGRALQAQAQCKTNLYGGIAGGIAIGAGIVGIFLLIRNKRKNKGQKKNQ